MNQSALFHEDIFEAIRTDIMAAGGTKKVGNALRSTLTVQAAGEWLANCLNRTRAEKLDPEDVLAIKRMARSVGSYATITYEMQELCMTMPQAIEPEDERARLQREFISAVQQLDKIKSQLGKVA